MEDFQGLKSHKEGRGLRTHAEAAWNESQRLCASAFRTTACEVCLTGLVLFSFVLVVMEADYGSTVPGWLVVTNNALVVVYAVEMMVRIFIFRWFFFTTWFNIFDLIVVVLEVGSHLLVIYFQNDRASAVPSVAPLRVVRLFRIARGYRVIMKFPQLALMVKGLFSAASAAVYGVVLLGIILTIWGVFAVHFIQPVVDRISLAGGYAGCERCQVAFSSVRNSMLTFTQQIIAGDSWGQVTMPIIEESPTTSLFFLCVFVSMNFTIMNVILAVIVDSALKASQGDVDELLKHKQESAVLAKEYLAELCKELTTQDNGGLSEADLRRGFDQHPDFRDILTTMDIKAEDMSVVFNILDQDGNGTVEANEFMDELFKMKAHDSHTLLVFIKHYSMEIRKDVQAQLGLLKTGMYNVFKLLMDEEMKHEGITVAQRDKVLQSFERGGTVGALLEHGSSSLGVLQEFPSPTRQSTFTGGASRIQSSMGTSRMSAVSDPPSAPEGQVVASASVEDVRVLREELGAELSRLRSVVSEELLGSMQHLSVKLNLEESAGKAGKADEKRQLSSAWTQLDSRESKLLNKACNPGALAAGNDPAPDSVQITPRDSAGLRVPSSVWGIRNAECDGGPTNRVRSSPDGHLASPSDVNDPRTTASAPSLFRIFR